MKIGSKFQPLPFFVECKSTHPFFETIAQFDCRPAAEGYVASCSTANPAFEYRITEPFAPIDASLVERMIVAKLVRDLLAADYVVTVYDGEEDALVGSTDEAAIFKALASTDADTLRVSKRGAFRGGSFVYLVWGNDCDVISDYGMSLEDVIRPALDLCNELEGQ